MNNVKNLTKAMIMLAMSTSIAAGRDSKDNFEIKRENLSKYTADISEFLMQARAIPERDRSGNITGYQVTEIEPGSVYEKFGLKNGDSIREVNGTPVTSPMQAMELFTALKNTDKLSIKIQRDGKTATKTYNIK